MANVIPAVYIILAESIPHLTNERQIDTLSQERFYAIEENNVDARVNYTHLHSEKQQEEIKN